jgi:hypothetical protein
MLIESGLTPSTTRQHAHEYAEETARQANIYKNARMPKSQDTVEDDEENVA